MFKKIFSHIVTVILFAGCSHSVENTIRCIQVDALEKVFTEESYFVENADTAAVAKGEIATFQFVIRSVYPIQDLKIEAGNLVNGEQKITPTLKAFVGYIRAGFHSGRQSKDAILPVSDYYPDCLLEVESIDVPSMQNQPVWISYFIPQNVDAGNYSTTLVFSGTVEGKPIKISKKVNVKVYPVTLPEQTLWITNWWSPFEFSKMNGNQPVEPYSDLYWELLTAMAHVMRDHGQNSYKIGGYHQDDIWTSLCNVKVNGKEYAFDFTNFDKMVEILIREGGLKRIEGGHLGGRMGGWISDFGINVPFVGRIPIEDERTQNYLSQFLPALYSHIESKGWTGMYVQYIVDEPLDDNADTYVRIAKFVKKYMPPEIPILEAIMTDKLDNIVDIWVPKLDHYREINTFFRERQAAGDEVWFYTCNEPQGNFLNRYVELPLVQTRLTHWVNYRFGLTGFLHWGFNYWSSYKTDDLSYGTLPAGDASIVYPAEGKVYSSIRLEAMRDGIADYELLKLLGQKSPDKAKELVSVMIKDVDSYNSNVRVFRQTRLKLLKLLCE